MSRAPSTDVVIVGNGMIGLASARALKSADPDLDVVVIGPSARPGGASAAAGAMLGCYGEVTQESLASSFGRAKHEMSVRSRELWPGLLAQLRQVDDGGGVHHVQGTFVIINGRSGDLDSANFAAQRAELVRVGEPFEDVDEVPGLRPVPDARPLRAIYLPNEDAVDAHQVLILIERLTRRLGVRFLDTTVKRVLAGPGERVAGVETADGEVVASSRVVVAAGAFSGPLLDELLGPSVVQPVLAGSGVALVTERVLGKGFPHVVRSVNRAGSCGLHVVPLGGAREYYGATNVIFGSPEFRAHLGVVHFISDCAMQQLDQDSCYSRIDDTRVGNRPVSLDTFPLLGGAGMPGLTVATGTYRDGFQCAPWIAELVKSHVLTGSMDTPFDPTRRPVLRLGVQDAIDCFVDHSIAGVYEGRTSLSPFLDSTLLGDIYRPRAEALHERLGMTDLGLPPDLINFLTLSRKSDDDVVAIHRYLTMAGLSTGGSR